MTTFIYDTKCVRGATFEPTLRYSRVLCPSSTTTILQAGTPVLFAAQTGLTLVNGTRVRASLLGPVEDPSIFIEGPVTAYSGGHITIAADNFGGLHGSSYSSWRLTAAVDLSTGIVSASMRFSPSSCAGRSRNPVAFSIIIASNPPKSGVFSLYLSPSQTALLALGDYQYKVLFQPASSSDNFLVVSGTISVVDE